MARKPAAVPDPAPALPSSGGAYELIDGQLTPVPAPEEASETAPETPDETGA